MPKSPLPLPYYTSGTTYPILDQTIVGSSRISWLCSKQRLERSSLDPVERGRSDLGRFGAEEVTVTGDSLRVGVVKTRNQLQFSNHTKKNQSVLRVGCGRRGNLKRSIDRPKPAPSLREEDEG